MRRAERESNALLQLRALGHCLLYRGLSTLTTEKTQAGQIFSFGLVKPALNLAAIQLQRH